jgi:hypothetical protein
MATATVAKSVMRKNDNISVGYGEVPAVEVFGIIGWGLPGGEVTYSEEIALGWAIKIDSEIRTRITNVTDLMTASTKSS